MTNQLTLTDAQTQAIHDLSASTDQTPDEILHAAIEQFLAQRGAGYMTEKTTIYGQLQKLLDAPIEVAPDLWDRRYNVDFAIPVGEFFIGLQIKPMSFYNASEFYKWRDIQAATHQKFEKKFGGAVFTVVSVKEGAQKTIANAEIVAQIQTEIARLRAVCDAT